MCVHGQGANELIAKRVIRFLRQTRTRLGLALAIAILPAAPAHADWFKASSDHFVIYAKDDAEDLKTLSRKLESFHAAMALVTGGERAPPSPSNRVTIFVVGSERAVRRLHGGNNRYVGGFYAPRAGNPIAVVPSVRRSNGGRTDTHLVTLLHEYAHHFSSERNTFPVPRWISEGSAEFFSSVKFERDGTLSIGMPAHHRKYELGAVDSVGVEALLDQDYNQRRYSGSAYNAFYGRSWLLYHYLSLDPEVSGQLKTYLNLLTAGKSSREAGLEAFGDFGRLDRKLGGYLRKRRLLSLRFTPDLMPVGPIEVTALSEGEAAILPVRIESQLGVNEEEAAELVEEAREIAARYPDDPAVLAALAETEVDADNYDAAIAAADKAIARDPGRVNAYIQKGKALFAKAEDADDRAEAYAEAVKPFLALNRVENDHPIPLVYFYRSFAARGLPATDNAIAGLEYAAVLAPFDLGLKLEVARMQLADGRPDDARRSLIPVAYNPHGGKSAELAQAMIDKIDSGDLAALDQEALQGAD